MSEFALCRKSIRMAAHPEKAIVLQRFFKTGKGEYGEGDVFLGISVPESRRIAKQFSDLPLPYIGPLLCSRIHEERLIALLILVQRFYSGDLKEQGRVVRFYLQYIRYVNNWDLVDLSADKILGAYLLHRPKKILMMTFAKSQLVWKRRIAIIATYYFIKHGQFDQALRIAEALLHDSHDLIQKAVGWMLREVGKRSLEVEDKFLDRHYHVMPRTMLRYAIEKFPEQRRRRYLMGIV